MVLKDLEGKHIFTGVELCKVEAIGDDEWHGLENGVRFELDGKTYLAIEDPSDGYRSYMRELRCEGDNLLKHKIPPIEVVCRYKDYTGNYIYACDLLDFIDVNNGKVFLTIGTKDLNDYYPICVFDYTPENLSINHGG